METIPELEPLSGDCETAVSILDTHLGLNSSMLVLPEAAADVVPTRELSPEPGTFTAMAGPDPNAEPDPDAEMTPLSPLTSEVKVHAHSDVTAETSDPVIRVKVASSPVAFAAPALVPERQDSCADGGSFPHHHRNLDPDLHMGPEDIVLLLLPGGWQLVAE